MHRKSCATAAGWVVLALSLIPAADLRGESPKTLRLGPVELALNGSGFRKKGLLTLYEGALYLPQAIGDPDAIIRADQPMAIRIQITSALVSQQNLVEALTEGFHNATGGNTATIASQIQQFRALFSDPVRKDDVFILTWFPERGVLVHKNGRQLGLIAGHDFKQALFGIWLSERPADAGLKQAMLGVR